MTVFQSLPPEFLAVLPLSLAAGLDLYLTLLLLGLAHASGLWPDLPGGLADLNAPGVVPVLGGFWLLELLAERYALPALLWNVFHAAVRPLAGALLALLLLEGHPTPVLAVGALGTAALTSVTHLVRTGGSVLLWLHVLPVRRWIVVSVLEDAIVLALVFLTLDHATWSLAAAALLVAGALPLARSQLRAFRFAVLLGRGRFEAALGRSRWTPGRDVPRWVQTALAGDASAPAGALRGCPAGADHLLPGALFAIGWVVIRGSRPAFVHRRPRAGASVMDLTDYAFADAREGSLARCVRLERDGEEARLHIPASGPTAPGLGAALAAPAAGT